MGTINIKGLCKGYLIKDRFVPALSDINLQIDDGEFVTVVGKSGCGKTTLLRLLSGLEYQDSGDIRIENGSDKGNGGKVSIVFQEPRLMPWLTVRENITFSRTHESTACQLTSTVEALLGMLGLTAFQHAYPSQISGGMAQRTALGRTLYFDPDIILMDEPFGALDAFTRRKLQHELVEIFCAHHKTIIFVTHDVDEAVLLGQRIVVMEDGRIINDLPNTLPYPREVLATDFLVVREKIIRSVIQP